MFEAQLLIEDGGSPTIFSPWFPRQADVVRCTVEVVALIGDAKAALQAYTKKAEEAGDGAAINPTVDLDAVGRITFEIEDPILDLVRFKFTGNAGSTGDSMLLRLLSPIWFDAIGA